jgi:hypothetical protein
VSRYKIMVDDNFHYMDEEHRYGWKSFQTAEEAIAECKRMVDSDLAGFLKPGIAATELYDTYTSFGDDPFIVRIDPNAEPAHFSAWDYAKERSDALTADKAASKTAPVANDATAREAPKSGQGVIIVGAKPLNRGGAR